MPELTARPEDYSFTFPARPSEQAAPASLSYTLVAFWTRRLAVAVTPGARRRAEEHLRAAQKA